MPDHPMTDEQIRDRLAEIKGYKQVRPGIWTLMWRGYAVAPDRPHPIPALDSPGALGVIAGMLPGACVADETRARALAVIAAHNADAGAKKESP